MDRRAFIGTLAGGLLAAPLAAEAQSAGKPYRIGLFHVGLDHVPPSLDGIRDGLKALGYDTGTSPAPRRSAVIEGKNIRLDWHNLPDEAAARVTAREFVHDRVDLVVAFENQTVRAAKAEITQIPVVFLHVQDPVADGFVESLARPGRNLTGFAGIGNIPGKELSLFKELVPRLRRPLILLDPDDPGAARWLAETRKAGTTLKLELVERPVGNEQAIERVFQTLKPGDVDGVLVASPDLRVKFHSVILRLASERRLPMVGHRREWVEQGALFSYADNVRAIGRAAVTRYIDRILKGAKPADLPVEEISEFELVINLKTAKALGLTIPPSLLQRADQVIE
jgi:putative tryptophan/tyrosine transport system substrate-binding protein